MLDMTESIAPRSDQMNAEDLLSGPRTFTIKEVRKGSSAEQPIDVHLVEFPAGRPFKPSKTVRRIMVAAWGKDATTYAGKRLTLYRDPEVRFGGQEVGGIRISHMSHLDKPLKLALTATRGKRAIHVVKPLEDDTPPPPAKAQGVTGEQLAAINTGLDALGIAEREAKLATVCQVVGRDLGSARDLTAAEGDIVLGWIAAQDSDDEPTPPVTTDRSDSGSDWPATATIPGTDQ